MSTRVFRFKDPVTGAPQISKFPETAPDGATDKIVRIRHFTEIENFTFLGYVLAHELGEEALGDVLLSVGIDWEHFVASTIDLLIPGDPLKLSDPVLQAIIDDLDQQTEETVAVINRIALAEATPKTHGGRDV